MKINEQLLEVKEYYGEGYRPLIDYKSWRVAVLRYCDELLPQNIAKMQRHDETDEVFVLLQGRCILFIGEGRDELTKILPQEMEPQKFYNVRRSVWHTHTLSKDAIVLIVENSDTALINSPEILLSEPQKKELLAMTEAIWPRENKPYSKTFNLGEGVIKPSVST